uniref:Uncharacterized protein n=1 Tax=Zea mays TaxID=4577 RepID=B6UBF6_MAIZE|nr:hypothetical protein [Zea mays]
MGGRPPRRSFGAPWARVPTSPPKTSKPLWNLRLSK